MAITVETPYGTFTSGNDYKIANPPKGIHDSVRFSGTGKIIMSPGAQIRHFSVIEMSKGVLKIGTGSVLGFFTMVQCTGEMEIGNNVLIGPHCTLLASYHPMSSDPAIQKQLIRSTLVFEDNIWGGANVVYNCGVTLHRNSVIAANSFVNKDVPENAIVGGSPAKLIKYKG